MSKFDLKTIFETQFWELIALEKCFSFSYPACNFGEVG